MTTDNLCFYLQNRRIQTSQTGGQGYSDTSPLSIAWFDVEMANSSGTMADPLTIDQDIKGLIPAATCHWQKKKEIDCLKTFSYL